MKQKKVRSEKPKKKNYRQYIGPAVIASAITTFIAVPITMEYGQDISDRLNVIKTVIYLLRS